VAYQFKAVPLATKSATVLLPQNVCADAVGAEVEFTVSTTGILVLLQPFTD
jgi:hypothetical protein